MSIFRITSSIENHWQVKHLLELLQDTYDELRDENEIAIIEKYWNIAKRYTEMLTRKTISQFSLFRKYTDFI